MMLQRRLDAILVAWPTSGAQRSLERRYLKLVWPFLAVDFVVICLFIGASGVLA
jgi:hypothetical protein